MIPQSPTASSTQTQTETNLEGSQQRIHIPIPLSVTLYNAFVEHSALHKQADNQQQERPEQDNTSNHRKWFRPEHELALLPTIHLQIIVHNDRVVFDSSTAHSNCAVPLVHPSWGHLNERVDLPDRWWIPKHVKKHKKVLQAVHVDDSDCDADEEKADPTNKSSPPELNVYPTMKLRFFQPTRPSHSILEVPVYPSKLQRLPDALPDALPINACVVSFSDGSLRVPPSLRDALQLVQLHVPNNDKYLTRSEDQQHRIGYTSSPSTPDRDSKSHSHNDEFLRFEDNVFEALDGAPEPSQSRFRTESVGKLLDSGGSALPDDGTTSTSLSLPAIEQDPSDANLFWDAEEAEVIEHDSVVEGKRLQTLLEQEESVLQHERQLLEQEKSSMRQTMQEAERLQSDIIRLRSECRSGASKLYEDEWFRQAQAIKLVHELSMIYPIAMDKQKGYLIRNLRLPVDINTTTVPDDEHSAALGFACHAIFLLSKYLHVALRHGLFCNSSRSAIQQDGGRGMLSNSLGSPNPIATLQQWGPGISMTPTGSFFPLFSSRFVEREQLERGVKLLGQNVNAILTTYQIEYTPSSHILARIQRIYRFFVQAKNAATSAVSRSSHLVAEEGMAQ